MLQEPLGVLADLDPSLVQQILGVAQRQREADAEHHRQADDLWACLDATEGRAIYHPAKLGLCRIGLNGFSADSAIAPSCLLAP